jgi:hypothetical protein
MVISKVSDDVGHAIDRLIGILSVDDRDANPLASEPFHDSTADEAATTRDQYATIDP